MPSQIDDMKSNGELCCEPGCRIFIDGPPTSSPRRCPSCERRLLKLGRELLFGEEAGGSGRARLGNRGTR